MMRELIETIAFVDHHIDAELRPIEGELAKIVLKCGLEIATDTEAAESGWVEGNAKLVAEIVHLQLLFVGNKGIFT
ncbi:hypothetical protein PsorP6_013650 [Peronosclerospora sorghi]|uniref:Uncharacterized protein n=1 Tax=Peronosclerospora sorghi TaxID=230839 RepID=A0ACC0VJK5_9STRA|nr:hypothetical protein PsorP6_013650 [Peronosclerospora sorghi]